ncbi:MAG: hypothetical protein ABI895_21245 [Deltaproteobacteria bacterium]
MLLGAAVLYGCSRTATDDPRADPMGTASVDPSSEAVPEYRSPDSFSPFQFPPKCGPSNEEASAPTVNGARALALQLPSQVALLARGDIRGLELIDVSDPARPRLASRGAVRGFIAQLLPSSAGQLWVAASEPPAPSATVLPTVPELDYQTRIVRLDVSDPTAPVRIAELPLQQDFLHLEERAGDLWVLTGRRAPGEQGCRAVQSPCGRSPAYEVLELRGYHPDGSRLEPIASAELPLGRLWWARDGVATATDDGLLHVLAWDDTGSLRSRTDVSLPGERPWTGPLEIAGGELSWVGYANGRNTLYRFDLTAPAATPPRSFDLGAHPAAPGAFSLFFDGKLWVNHGYEQADAQLWDVSGAAPERIPLPDGFTKVFPVSGAVLDAQPGATAMLGWQLETTQVDPFVLLSLDSQGAHIVGNAGTASLNTTSDMSAPPGLRGIGSAPAWRVKMRGAGLPLGVDPSTPRDDQPAPSVLAFVGIRSGASPDSPVRAEAALVATYVRSAASQANPRLEIQSEAGSFSFEVPPTSGELIALPNGVLVPSTEGSDYCPQDRDCSDYVPGVTLFDTTGEPRRVAWLPMPEPQLEVPWDPSRMSLRWTALNDPLTGAQQGALRLGEQHVAFVAKVSLGCQSQGECDALGIEAVPVTPSQGLQFALRCSLPDSPPDCVEPPTPTLVGGSTRQYFFALRTGGGAPSWLALGVSTPESRASSLAGASVFGTTLAALRLEHVAQILPTGYVPTGQSRFMLDRFRLDASGEPLPLPPVNVPGYPAAYLGADGAGEYWLTAEPLPDATGRARLHRLRISASGAESQAQLDLDGPFVGFWPLQSADASFGLTLSSAKDACGATRLTAVRLGAASSSVALEPVSFLDLPSDHWAVVAIEAQRAVLRRGPLYALIELDSVGRLTLVALKSSDDFASGQLLGTTLRAGDIYGGGELKLEF